MGAKCTAPTVPITIPLTMAAFIWVALNSLDHMTTLWYYGGIDSVQREWLKKDLAAQPAKMPVVTFQHVLFQAASVWRDIQNPAWVVH